MTGQSSLDASMTQMPSTSLISGTSLSGKNTTIILPGDKKPKTIGGGRKTEIKADVVSILNNNNNDNIRMIRLFCEDSQT